MWSLLADALGLAVLAVGGVLTAVRVALWAALFLRGSEPPPAPRNTPLRRTKGEGDPPPPKNERIRPRHDGDAFRRYLALTGVTALMTLVLGGCGFMPPISDTTRIETPTVSGVNAVTEVNRYGGVVNSVRVTVPPSNIRDCANFLDEALVPPASVASQESPAPAPAQTALWLAWLRLQTRFTCLQQQQRVGAEGGLMGPNMLGMGPFPGGRTFKGEGER